MLPAADSSRPMRRAGRAPADLSLFTGVRQIDPICTVADRRQVDLDGTPNGGSLHA
jgi:hypothetical protein